MFVISFFSQKGGVGKTTLSNHLAVKLTENFNVGIMDLDPQGSLAAWRQAREQEEPYYINVKGSLSKTIKNAKKAGIDVLIMDTAPNTINGNESIDLSDLVLVPVKASPHDIKTVHTTLGFVKDREKVAFIVNDAKPNTTMTKDTKRIIGMQGTLAATINSRVGFSDSQVNGLTMNEIEPNGKGANEINQLYNFVLSKMNERNAGKVAA